MQDRLEQDSDEIQFAAETEANLPEQFWKILIVDDEVEVHEVTRLALSDFTFEGKSIAFLSAYSAAEAKPLLREHPDIAIVFLDVVMETENAGLDVVTYIRQALQNSIARIIVRTGQPGQAPENVVAVNYGIDDYKLKTELTSQKLAITVVTALRAFSTLTQMLEMQHYLQQKVAQQEQAEVDRRLSQTQKQERANPPERSLPDLQHHFQENQSPISQRQKLEALEHLVTEITHEITHSPNQTGALYTLSMITRIARMVLRMTDEHSARLGISQSKLAVLMYLNSEPAQCASPSALAKHCGVSRAAMTGLLDGLEQEGYVERDDHPFDRRALQVKLTEKGQRFLDWLTPQDQYQLFEQRGTLDNAESQNLIALVMQVIKLLDAQTDSSPDKFIDAVRNQENS